MPLRPEGRVSPGAGRLSSLIAATAAATLLASVASMVGVRSTAHAIASPNPVTCEGYPEKRVYLEAQSWWEAQPGPPGHPGTGQQGHIHVGTCFPLYQKLSGPSI